MERLEVIQLKIANSISGQSIKWIFQYNFSAIREAGGAFGKIEVAREEEYFYKKQQEQLKKLKTDQISQADYHQKQIEEHEVSEANISIYVLYIWRDGRPATAKIHFYPFYFIRPP